MARTAISSLVLCFLVQTGNAQIVRYGPGGAVRVRAPFVRVDVGPGGSYVRAPFTSVYRPRYWGDRRYSLNPDDLTQKTLPELRSSLVAHWTLLQQELGRFKNGASWQKHLQLLAGRTGDSTDPLAVANADPVEFKNVLGRFDRVAKDPKYGGISRLASFQATHRLLSVYLDRLMKAAPEMPPPPAPEILPQPQPQLPGSQET